MNLEIKYNSGTMIVHLEEFLKCRSITKFRKLVKLIGQSFFPDEVTKIIDYIEEFNSMYDAEQKMTEGKIAAYSHKIGFCEKRIDYYTRLKDSCKKQSENWITFNDNVKEYREELKQMRCLLGNVEREYKDRARDKEFFNKCSKVLRG